MRQISDLFKKNPFLCGFLQIKKSLLLWPPLNYYAKLGCVGTHFTVHCRCKFFLRVAL